MIREDYVSYETAKLLKEKGFDWCESPFYSEQDRDEWRQNNSYTVPNEEYDPDLPFDSETLTLVAPHVSIQMAMKWLREVQGIDISIAIRFWTEDEEIYIKSWKYTVYHTDEIEGFGQSDTYEEACESAIRFCLENLI